MRAVKKKKKKTTRKKEVFSCVRAALVFAFNYSVLGGKLRYRGAEYRCGTSWVPQSCVVTVCFVAIYHHRHVFYCTDRSRRLRGEECGRRGEGGVEPLSVDVLRGMRVVAALGAGTGFFTTSAVQAVQLSVHLGMHMSHFFCVLPAVVHRAAFCECVSV